MIDNNILYILGSLIVAFLITIISIPSIIKIADLKHLYDEPGARKSHNSAVPTLGGLAIFAGFIFSATFWVDIHELISLQYIIAATLIMFFIGLKDDIIAIDPYKKFIIQIVAAVILVHWGNIKLTSLYGILGVNDIPIIVSYPLSIFTILVITNSFNLIDGINGLSGGIGVTIATTFGIFFYKMGSYNMAIIAFALVGSLIGFLRYNLINAKIFMGDTGSLLIGIISSVLAIEFIEANKMVDGTLLPAIISAPAIAFGILIVPLFDLLKVFVNRVMRGKSPFNPDKGHIHHILLRKGMTHIQATLFLVLVNIFFILMVFTFKNLGSFNLLLIILGIAILLSSILVFIRLRKE